METAYNPVASRLKQALSSSRHRRILVAVAGPPGSGKTTIANQIIQQINSGSSSDPGPNATSISSICVSVDGFHYTRAYLESIANREEAKLHRGAPWAFDVDAIIKFVEKLKRSAELPKETRSVIKAPSFDHGLGDPVEDGIEISAEANIIILIGNYLLLDMQRWREVSRLVDMTIFVDSDVKIARLKVAKRLVEAGIEETYEKAMDKIDDNDDLNGELLRKNLVPFDVKIDSKDPAA